MTTKQYCELAQNFAKYANKTVFYKKKQMHKMDKYIWQPGTLVGIGVGDNTDKIIISKNGYTYAIHFDLVDFPNTNK